MSDGPATVRFGRWEVLRLWLGYQRYAFLLWLACAAIVAIPTCFAARWWFVWVWPAAYFVFKLGTLGVIIYARFPRKLRATIVAERRIRRGSFEPVGVKQFCGDPCFRLVAHEILHRAGYPATEQKAMVAEFARQRRDAPNVVVLVDRARGVTITVDGREVSPGDIDSINEGA